MRTDKKYMMIVTEEDDRYDAEDGYDCDFYADHPWEGNLIDICLLYTSPSPRDCS